MGAVAVADSGRLGRKAVAVADSGRLGRRVPDASADAVEMRWQFAPPACHLHSSAHAGGAEGAEVAGRIAESSSAKESDFSLEGVECIVSPATKLDLHVRVPISAVVGKVLLASAQLQ